MTLESRPPRTVPERDADPTLGLVPPSLRTPETAEGKELTAARKAGAGNIMGLANPQSAILSAVIIIALVPLALRGVPYRPAPAAELRTGGCTCCVRAD